MLAMADENSRRTGWALSTCMVAEGIRVQSDDAAQMSCFMFRSVREPECRPWNPTIDSGVLNYSKLYENGGLVAGPAAVPDSFNGSFAEIDEGLVGPSREREGQSSDGASNCVEAAIDFPVSASDSYFAHCDNFKIENSVEGCSSLDRIGEPTNGFRNMATGVNSSGRFDSAGYSDGLLPGISTMDYWHTPLQFQFLPQTTWEAGFEDEDDEMELDTPPAPARLRDAYHCAERLTEAEISSFAYDTQFLPEESSPTSSRTAMPHVNVPDMIQHKRAKVHWSGHVATTAPSDTAGSSSTSGTELLSCQNFSNRGSSEMMQSNSSAGANNGRETNDSSSGGDDDDGDEGDLENREDHEVKMDLTEDLLHMVFSFLDHSDLCRAAMVCRQWWAASAHEDFWKSLNFENRKITREQVAQLCRKYPKAVELNVRGTPHGDELVREAMHSLRNLEVLILGQGCLLSDGFFNGLVDFPVLDRLSIAEATLGSGSQEILVRHDSLRHLQIIRCRVIRISVRCPHLEILSLRRSCMASATLTCPQLHELDVASCHKLSDAGVRVAATSCPLLTSLDMSNCSYVSDETLREIAAACPNLRLLDASLCPNISLEAVRMPMLTDMKLHSCEGINASSMAALSHCFMLESLQLDFCWLLTSVTLELPRLQNISLVHCKKFVELNLRCPVLASVNVSNCSILNRIDITSSALQKLVLQKQPSLTTMALQCLRLREVDLTECESLTNSICKVFSEGGGCPMLNTLILDSCESLTMVELISTSLRTLSLVGCRAMTSLHLACPNLQHVYLDGCDHLEGASFCPVGLQSLNLGICPHLSKLDIEAPQMTVLELKGCGILSQAAINCPQLLSLDASFCGQLQDDCLVATTASCPMIQSLILMSCPSIGSNGLFALGLLSNLTLLDLSYTFLTNLQPVFESCNRLKVLKLQACKYLMDTSLDPLHRGEALPDLCELDLSYGSLCQSAIEKLLARCPHLTHVSLNGCTNMHDLDWGPESAEHYNHIGIGNAVTVQMEQKEIHGENAFDWMDEEKVPDRLLQNLNCVGCPNIKKVAIPVSALCFHLSSLNLSLSSNLKDVDLACCNLVSLNLSNCSALEILKLNCPRLTSLLLQACGIEEQEVESAILSCNSLETLDVRFCPKISSTGIANLRTISPGLKRLFSSVSV